MKQEFLHKYNTLKSKLQIDLLHIDQEFMELPALVQDAAELAAEIKEEERTLAHQLEITRAEVSARLRKVEKPPSETAIQSMLLTEESVQQARAEREQMQYYAEIATALANSLRDKVHLIRKTADMILGGFISADAGYQTRRTELRRKFD